MSRSLGLTANYTKREGVRVGKEVLGWRLLGCWVVRFLLAKGYIKHYLNLKLARCL